MSGGNPLKAGHPMALACRLSGVDGICATPAQSPTHGLCGKHWKRWKRWGDPLKSSCRRRLPDSEVRRLRRLLGMPEDGPSPTQKRRWTREEAS